MYEESDGVGRGVPAEMTEDLQNLGQITTDLVNDQHQAQVLNDVEEASRPQGQATTSTKIVPRRTSTVTVHADLIICCYSDPGAMRRSD